VRGDSSWNFDRLTVPKNQKQIVSLASHKLFLWSVDAVIRQLEGPVVDRNAGFCAENLVGSNGFFGSHVHWRHKPARLICTDGQQCKPRRAKLFPNPCEMISEACVAGEIHESFREFALLIPCSF